MFRLSRISTKLGLIYSALFAAMMLAIVVITYAVVTDRARIIVGDQIVASGEVFTHLFVERGADLQADARLQVRDFGFRSAITSEDLPTVVSALETLKQRLLVDGLAYVDIDGAAQSVVGADLPLSKLRDQIAESAFGDYEHAPGIAFRDEQALLAGYVPVLAPDLVGFVVFGDAITEQDIAEIVDLSAIPLAVQIAPLRNQNALSGSVEQIEGDVVYRHQIPALVDAQAVELILSYPLQVAFAPFRVLVLSLGIISLTGALLVCAASWLVAGRLSRPVAALAEAANRVRQGDEAKVSITTGDELQGLATAFNHMSSEVRSREQEIKRRARLDIETMLPNRLAFEEAIALHLPNNTQMAVIAIGIDRFSEIRSALGFEASAALLQDVFKHLSEHAGVLSTALVSGDVLAALVMNKADATIESCAEDLRRALNRAFQIHGNSIDIIITMGVSRIGDVTETAALKRAMIALDQARASNVWRAEYDNDRYVKTSDNLSLMGDLLKAIENNHLFVEYQPKFDLRAGLPVGVEALVRWNDPKRGKVYPDLFIPLAEETGHIERLTEFVLSESVTAQEILHHSGHDLCMSVNISGRLVGNSTFTDKAMQLASRAVGKICFEITETAVMEHPEDGIAALNAFVAAGIDISIDDYGSGLSSLAYLKQLPATELKIDKAFILEIDKSQRDVMLARSTIDLAHSLGMKVTAEGIETETAMVLLSGMGCDVGQGYYLGRPMPLQNLLKFLSTHCHSDFDEPATRPTMKHGMPV